MKNKLLYTSYSQNLTTLSGKTVFKMGICRKIATYSIFVKVQFKCVELRKGEWRGQGLTKKVVQRESGAAKEVRQLNKFFSAPNFSDQLDFCLSVCNICSIITTSIESIIIPPFCQPDMLIPVYLSTCKSECTHRLILSFWTF